MEAVTRARDQFLATLAHELRNPLAAVRNSILAARLDERSRPRSLEIALRQSKHLARLLDDLLDVAQVTQGKVALRKQEVSLKTAIEHALEAAGPVLRAWGHESVSARFVDETLHVEADPLRLEQIILNLIDNASRFTKPGGSFDLSM